jgi:hypothetical protein
LDGSREEWADQIDAIRADLEKLTSTVSRVANTQLGRAQEKAVEAAQQAEQAVRRNPISALAIAFGVGWRIQSSIELASPSSCRPAFKDLAFLTVGFRRFGQGRQRDPRMGGSAYGTSLGVSASATTLSRAVSGTD